MDAMKISMETYVLRERFDDAAAVKMIKQAGFDCYDYSMYWVQGEKDMLGDDYSDRARKLRKIADDLDITCNQAHAPFDLCWDDEFDVKNERYLRLVRSLEAASILGAKTIIIHVLKNNVPENVDFYDLNRTFLWSLLPYCQKFGIHISVENLFGWEDKAIPVLGDPLEHMNFVQSLNSEYFNICIDVGHSAITGYKPEEVIGAMNGEILQALHIHDNDQYSDAHMLPFTGSLDWEEIRAALKKINYAGELTMELTGYQRKVPSELLQSAINYAAEVARYLAA